MKNQKVNLHTLILRADRGLLSNYRIKLTAQTHSAVSHPQDCCTGDTQESAMVIEATSGLLTGAIDVDVPRPVPVRDIGLPAFDIGMNQRLRGSEIGGN